MSCIGGLSPVKAQVTVSKHPISISLSNNILQKIDKETLKEKRSRSEWVELHFEDVFAK
jgi:metal-responsive CopG/Arc/MetJ family transcriptional regulator